VPPLFINAELSQIPISDGRKAERRIVNLAGALRESGAKTAPIIVLDISIGGFKADVPEPIEEGGEVWLRIAGFAPKRSRVVWTNGKEVGCEFETPLHEAELDQIVSPAPRRVPKGIFRRA
jgi:hypothetical protein